MLFRSDDGSTGYALADDLDPEPSVEPWVRLLPALDSTSMGWTDRSWYLGPHKAALFDANIIDRVTQDIVEDLFLVCAAVTGDSAAITSLRPSHANRVSSRIAPKKPMPIRKFVGISR